MAADYQASVKCKGGNQFPIINDLFYDFCLLSFILFWGVCP